MESTDSDNQTEEKSTSINKTDENENLIKMSKNQKVLIILIITICVLAVSIVIYLTTSCSFKKKSEKCFHICEPRDISTSGKLIRPIIIHDGVKPTRYFLYLFPEEPNFIIEEVGYPLYLTPYITQNRTKEAKRVSIVNLTDFPDIQSYAGFLTVSKKQNSNLFFWFFPSMKNPANDPVILWLQGGPGATSLFGLFKENGPILASLNRNTSKAKAEKNPFTWNREASLLYIDNPVGTGFSFSNSLKNYPSFINQSSLELFEGLQQFFEIFDEFVERDFYIMGESYAGKYIPGLCHVIHSMKKNYSSRVNINLKGLAIGNGWMSPHEQAKYASYLLFHGFLDIQQYMKLREIEDVLIEKIQEKNWLASWMTSNEQIDFILNTMNYSSLYDIRMDQYTPGNMDFWYYIQQPKIRKAMHVGNLRMSDGLNIYQAMIQDTMQSIKPKLVEALENYKVLIYHGAQDIICHFSGAQEMLTQTNWSGKAEYYKSPRKPLWLFNEYHGQKELAGYVKGEGKLKVVLIRNAGHSAPMDQPEWSMRIIQKFINDIL